MHEVLYIVGIPWSPEEFISKAASVEHPVSGFPDELKCAICRNAELSEQGSHGNDEAMASAGPLKRREGFESGYRRSILKGKRLVLLSRLLQEMDYADSNIAAEIGQGFSLTGKIPSSGVYKRKRKYAVLATWWIFPKERMWEFWLALAVAEMRKQIVSCVELRVRSWIEGGFMDLFCRVCWGLGLR